MSPAKRSPYAGYCHFHMHPGQMSLEQVRTKRCGEKHCPWFQENVMFRESRLKKHSKGKKKHAVCN